LLDAVVVLVERRLQRHRRFWALYLMEHQFQRLGRGTGSCTLFGVAIMDGLLLISYFNDARSRGLPLRGFASCKGQRPGCGRRLITT